MSVGDPKAAESAFKKALPDTRSPEQKAADWAREQAEIWKKAETARAAQQKKLEELKKETEKTREELGKLLGGAGKKHRRTTKRFFGRVKKVKSQKKKGIKTQKRRRT